MTPALLFGRFRMEGGFRLRTPETDRHRPCGFCRPPLALEIAEIMRPPRSFGAFGAVSRESWRGEGAIGFRMTDHLAVTGGTMAYASRHRRGLA
jgi:hypothetical protein